jgi:GT2 family glycosyltransferase
VERRWLDELIRPFLTTEDEIGATSSTIMSYYDRNVVENGGNGKLNIFGQTRASNKVERGIEETHTISGESFMMKREVLDGLEEFLCPEYFAYFEDIDLSWRLINRGYKLIYSPKSIVYHKGGMTSRKISDKMRVNNVRNKYLTFYRNLSNTQLLLVFPLLLFFDFASILVLIFYARRLNNARLRFKGIVEFFKLKRQVKRYGDGRISFLEKRIFWDKLYLSSQGRW